MGAASSRTSAPCRPGWRWHGQPAMMLWGGNSLGALCRAAASGFCPGGCSVQLTCYCKLLRPGVPCLQVGGHHRVRSLVSLLWAESPDRGLQRCGFTSVAQQSGLQTASEPMCQARCTSNIGVMMNAAKNRPIIRKNPAGQDIHSEVVCDGCNACPVVGIRYRSLTVPDHDLCEQCHSKPCSALAAPFERITSGTACHGTHPGHSHAAEV